MGFPSYTYFLLRLMEQRGVRVTCAPGSKIMLGGGWKQFYAEQVDKRELYSMAADRLGIGEEDIVEFYGGGGTPHIVLRLYTPPFPCSRVQPG